MKYPDDYINKVICGDCLKVMKNIPDNSVDLIVTDPPYQLDSIRKRFGKSDLKNERFINENQKQQGMARFAKAQKGFMGKEWDVLPSVKIWRECLHVLKPGAFAFVMCTPRQDSLCQMLTDLTQAGFVMGFSSIYWTYASGFPKAANIGKMVDKRLGNKRKVIGKTQWIDGSKRKALSKKATIDYAGGWKGTGYGLPITKGDSLLEGSYAGFQPKPAVEIILVCMKPLSEKTYVDQAMENGKGVTWLDGCRVPYINKKDIGNPDRGKGYPMLDEKKGWNKNKIINNVTIGERGRFPANLLVSDDVLNDGKIMESKRCSKPSDCGGNTWGGTFQTNRPPRGYTDFGSFSRYFSLDAWWAERIKQLPESAQKTFPFLIVPKASKGEKNRGLKDLEKIIGHNRFDKCGNCGGYLLQNSDRPSACKCKNPNRKNNKIKGNFHPTCKPLKLMSYLIMLGSREDDILCDPFLGSGTTAIAAKMLGRKFIGIEREKEYVDIAKARIAVMKKAMKQQIFNF